MKLFERCINCEHLGAIPIFGNLQYVCCINEKGVDHPRLMGGSRKCECYERENKQEDRFKYPKKEGRK